MSVESRNIIKVASTYITTIIGAGFASGQEIAQFFSIYYKGGFYGIVVAGVLFALIGSIVLDKVYRERIRNYDEFLYPSVGWLLGKAMEFIVLLFVFSLYCIMLAGMGSIVNQAFGIKYNYGIIFISIICMVMLMSNVKGLVTLSTITSPLLIVGIAGIGLYIIISRDITVFSISANISGITHNWFFSSFIYVSYNSILSVVMLCSLLPYLNTRKVGKIGGLLAGMVLMLIALILNTAVYFFFPDGISGELPVLSIIQKFSFAVSAIYMALLWVAMFTSAIASGFCFIDKLSRKFAVKKAVLTAVFCGAAIPLSSVGFSNLISSIYPVFGYAGMFLIFVILFQGVKRISLVAPKKKL